MDSPHPVVKPRIVAGMLAFIIGIQILSILLVLLFWVPSLLEHPDLFSNPEHLFPFIAERQHSWRISMFAGVLTSAAAVPLSVYLTRYFAKPNATDESILFIGTGALMIDIVATTMSFLGTSWLATQYEAHTELTTFVFNWSEAWRDTGLKTIAFLGIGIFTMRIAVLMRGAPSSRWIRLASWIYGGFMFIIGLADAFGKMNMGEYGVPSGIAHVAYAVWGLLIGHWFWFVAPPKADLFDATEKMEVGGP